MTEGVELGERDRPLADRLLRAVRRSGWDR